MLEKESEFVQKWQADFCFLTNNTISSTYENYVGLFLQSHPLSENSLNENEFETNI
jgi:hypothetical protein